MPDLEEELNAPFDPFADALEEEENAARTTTTATTQPIHLRIQQRNGRKTMTTFQGLPREYDINKIVKALKRKFACSGTIIEDEELGQVLKFSGDQRQKIVEFLVQEGIANRSEIKVHGF